MLVVENLAKTFGARASAVTALDNVNFRADRGQLVTIVGPSGCGKTTLLRAIAGFEIPDSGTVVVNDIPMVGPTVRPVPAHERGIGLVPQEGALFPHLSVAQNVAFGLKHLSRRHRQEVVSQTLELVGLANFHKRRPHELSGGQQQRVALARAIAPGPEIVLLDEPFSALDEYLRESLRTEVRSLLTELGTTAVLVTHDQEEALALGDHVAVMREGRVIQMGPPRETYFEPVDLELARFLGEVIIVDGKTAPARNPSQLITSPPSNTSVQPSAAAAQVSCVFGDLPVASWHGQSGACEVLIRPENIRVLSPDVPGPGLTGTILDQTFYGHDGILRVGVPELRENISVRVLGDHGYTVGSRVRLVVDRPVSVYSN